MIHCHVIKVIDKRSPVHATPALFIKTDGQIPLFNNSVRPSEISNGLDKSSDLKKILFLSFLSSIERLFRSSSDLAIKSKFHPALAKAFAAALPIPLEAPVIKTVDK